MSAFSGEIDARSALWETRSEGVEEACTHRYLGAMFASTGIRSLFSHHHVIGSTEDSTAGRLLYKSISLLIFSLGVMALVLLPTMLSVGPGLHPQIAPPEQRVCASLVGAEYSNKRLIIHQVLGLLC